MRILKRGLALLIWLFKLGLDLFLWPTVVVNFRSSQFWSWLTSRNNHLLDVLVPVLPSSSDPTLKPWVAAMGESVSCPCSPNPRSNSWGIFLFVCYPLTCLFCVFFQIQYQCQSSPTLDAALYTNWDLGFTVVNKTCWTSAICKSLHRPCGLERTVGQYVYKDINLYTSLALGEMMEI